MNTTFTNPACVCASENVSGSGFESPNGQPTAVDQLARKAANWEALEPVQPPPIGNPNPDEMLRVDAPRHNWPVYLVNVPEDWEPESWRSVPPHTTTYKKAKTAAEIAAVLNREYIERSKDGLVSHWYIRVRVSSRYANLSVALPTRWKPENEFDLPPAFIRIDGPRQQCQQIVGDLNYRLDQVGPGEIRKRAYIARSICPGDVQPWTSREDAQEVSEESKPKPVESEEVEIEFEEPEVYRVYTGYQFDVDPSCGNEIMIHVYNESDEQKAKAKVEAYFQQVKIKWAEFRERYETEVVPGLAERSAEKVATTFNHVESILNPNLLTQVDANGISKIVKELQSQGLEEITIKGYLAYLRTSLEWAVPLKLIQAVPVFPKFKRIRETKAMRGRPLSLDEFKLMLAAVPKVCGEKQAESWRFLLRGLWCSGLRISESLELYWDREDKLHVDLSGKRPMLRIRMEAEKGKKDRLIPIVPEFAALLAGVPNEERTGPVLNPIARIKRAERMLPSTVSKLVADIGEEAGIVVGDKGNVDKETGERKPRYASAHDLRRSFGERWSLKVMPDVLMLLMRHESIETTLKYYVGRNAQKAAEAVWSTVAGESDVSGDGSPNEEKPSSGESSKVLRSKDYKEPPRRVELLTYALRIPTVATAHNPAKA